MEYSIVQRVYEALSQVSQFGDLSVSGIESAFRDKLSQYGHDDVDVEADLGVEGGITLVFFDEEGDEVVVFFYIDADETPYAQVVSDDDDQIEVDLSPLEPSIMTVGGEPYLNLQDLSWMNKSTLNALLVAGAVGQGLAEAIQKRVMMGGRGTKLPIITRRKGSDDFDKHIIHRVKKKGRKIAPEGIKTFASKRLKKKDKNG